jgi:hypothetical protein
MQLVILTLNHATTRGKVPIKTAKVMVAVGCFLDDVFINFKFAHWQWVSHRHVLGNTDKIRGWEIFPVRAPHSTG